MFPGIDPLLAPINVAEKGSVTLDIAALAPGGHSSMPPSTTAVGKLAEAISLLEANPVPGGLSGLSAAMFDDISRHMPFGQRLLFANAWLFEPLIVSALSNVTFANAMVRTTTAPPCYPVASRATCSPLRQSPPSTSAFILEIVDSVIQHVSDLLASEDIEVRPRSGINASSVSSWDSEGFQS